MQDRTLNTYRKSIAPFVQWLQHNNYNPTHPDEFDDLIVEFKVEEDLSLSKLSTLLASVEYLFPRFKGKLDWTKSVIKGKSIKN